MLFVSTFVSDRERDPELWAVIWHGKAPPTLKLLGAYNLAGNRRLFIWEGETTADLQFMDLFNTIGVLETTPAFDRTAGWQLAFAGDIDGFRENLLARGGRGDRVEAAIDLRSRGLHAPTVEAARRAAREWVAERGAVAD
jgi:hypothetical protein